jgi:hypothetical protein
MKNRTTIALIALGLLVSAVPALHGSEKDAVGMIRHAASVLMAPDPSRDAILDGLVEILDASLLILPQTEYEPGKRSSTGCFFPTRPNSTSSLPTIC